MRKTIFTYAATVFGLALLTSSPLPGQGRYVRLQGVINSADTEAAPLPFHLDAYKITADGQRQLVRLSRFAGPDYHLYLETGYDHEVVIQMVDHPPHGVLIEALSPDTHSERLTLQKDFLVPADPGGGTIASARPEPPGLPKEEIHPVIIEAEVTDLFSDWGNPVLVRAQPPALPMEEILPLSIAFEETDFSTDWGGTVQIEAPVRKAAYQPPPAMPAERILAMVVEDEVLPTLDFGELVEIDPAVIYTDQPSEAIATIEMTTALGAPEHPWVFQDVVDAALPRAPRRARLRMRTNIVAGLNDEQQHQAIARLAKGQEIQVIEYTTPNWWMVSYGSLIGWVESQYLE